MDADFATDFADAFDFVTDILTLIDDDHDGLIEVDEVINAVQDVYTLDDSTLLTTACVECVDGPHGDVLDVATARDAVNNLEGVGALDLM